MPSLQDLGIAAGVIARLRKLGIRSPIDLALHLPLRYEDETRVVRIGDLVPGQEACIEGVVLDTQVLYRPRRTLVARIGDETGRLTLRFLHFYPSQIKQLAQGVRLRLHGELRQGYLGPEMVHPRYRLVTPETPLAQSLTPVYPTVSGLSQATLRRAIERALAAADLSETLPEPVRKAHDLPSFSEAVTRLHHPHPGLSALALSDRAQPAWQRLKFDELLAQQISMRMHYQAREREPAPPLQGNGRLRAAFLARLPFSLTEAQNRALAEIEQDMVRSHPMHRLLQGDVGSGKTVVAALACLRAIESGFQAALMAPTEILAEQHFKKIEGLLLPLQIRTAWLTGKLSATRKREALAQVANGEAHLVIGTHALIQGPVTFQRLGLVIIDEQHRFGVDQRLALRKKAEASGIGMPHQLMMSATPIPRTLSMSYFADLDVSAIDALPPGRKPIITKLVDDVRRDEVIERIRDTCRRGEQAYWVCPLIEESETLQLQTALDTLEQIRSTFPELEVGLVHGRLPAAEKSNVMERFSKGEIQLLVATTVIEVGVDVPNATVIVIEHAERMGLAQLHQLRGRVGRGTSQGTCVLLYHSPLSALARTRLKVIFEQTDGFEISRQDLAIRGPGEFLGSRQSGTPMLRFADVEQDSLLLESARATAADWIAKDPAAARRHLDRWLESRQEYLTA